MPPAFRIILISEFGSPRHRLRAWNCGCAFHNHPGMIDAGAVEFVATVLGVADGEIHPTVHYDNPDPNCQLDYTPVGVTLHELNIEIIKSPVGLPARAIRNEFLDRLESGEKMRIKCSYRCLTACEIKSAKYCIAKALLDSYLGRVGEGIIFCGQNVYRVDRIVSVKELIEELVAGIKAA
jgi:hypothetical protein